MIRIVIDSDIPYIRGVLEPYAEITYIKGADITAAYVRAADALIVRTRTRCDAALLEGSRVSIIASATVGYDHIDMDYCRSAGIEVATAAGSNARAVLQWFSAAMAYAAQAMNWEPAQKRLGVVGVGHVGSLVADYGRQWGFEVLCCDPPRKRIGDRDPAGNEFVDFEHITRKCDIITFHTPLTKNGDDSTYHLASENFFGRIAPGTLLLNASRGAVVDTPSFKEAIRDGRCKAIIDTWENEPHIDTSLLGASLLGTPHIAGYSAQGKANATATAVSAVARKFGLPLQGWYPPEVDKVEARPIGWQEMVTTIGDYFNIGLQSHNLKQSPQEFEQMRNNYLYRQEYF